MKYLTRLVNNIGLYLNYNWLEAQILNYLLFENDFKSSTKCFYPCKCTFKMNLYRIRCSVIVLSTRRDSGCFVSKMPCPENVTSRKDIDYILRQFCLVSLSIHISLSPLVLWATLLSNKVGHTELSLEFEFPRYSRDSVVLDSLTPCSNFYYLLTGNMIMPSSRKSGSWW